MLGVSSSLEVTSWPTAPCQSTERHHSFAAFWCFFRFEASTLVLDCFLDTVKVLLNSWDLWKTGSFKWYVVIKVFPVFMSNTVSWDDRGIHSQFAFHLKNHPPTLALQQTSILITKLQQNIHRFQTKTKLPVDLQWSCAKFAHQWRLLLLAAPAACSSWMGDILQVIFATKIPSVPSLF